MALRRTGFSAKQSKRKSRQMDESTIGTHVSRGSHVRQRANASSMTFSDSRTASRASRSQVQAVSPRTTSGEDRAAYRHRVQQRRFTEEVQHRARRRRILTVLVAAIIVVALALTAGFFAFRGVVGSEMALKNSDAQSALVPVKSDQPYYALIAADLGAAAAPLEQAGPDVVLLARVDRQQHTLALVNIPGGLQITVDNATRRLADTALAGDAALIHAVETFAKVDISHFVKMDAAGLSGMVDALGGIHIDVDQVIDDPHAGDLYLPQGPYDFNGAAALTYLRATNLKLGVSDQLQNQVDFAAEMLVKMFGGEGNFTAKMDSLDKLFQTDLTLGDLEELASWMGKLSANDITRVVLPGYLTSVSEVVDTGDAVYVSSASDMAEIIKSLDAGEVPAVTQVAQAATVEPGSFTVEVQNGTDVVGAASVTADTLTGLGFKVDGKGNAEQQVYNETLVIYKSDNPNGPGQAKTVIDALGAGRAVEAGMYYSFDTDILLIIGYDYKPVS